MSNPQSGQIAIAVMLIMVVLLTIGLSLASRTTEEIFLSQQQSESTRVFNAAESGAEDALSRDFSTITQQQTFPLTTIDGVTVNYTITPQSELERQLTEGGTATVLTNNNNIGNLTVEWGKNSAGCSDNASLIFSIYYQDSLLGGITRVKHKAVSPDGCSRGDGFESASPNSNPYNSRYTLSGVDSSVLSVRIKAVYNDTAIKVAGVNLPQQQYLVRSEAANENGTEQRTVEVTRGVSAPPAFMDYAVYTAGTIQKN